MSAATFPRVTVPGLEVDEEARLEIEVGRQEIDAQREHVRAQQRGMARAMVALGKPIFRGAPSKRKKKR